MRLFRRQERQRFSARVSMSRGLGRSDPKPRRPLRFLQRPLATAPFYRVEIAPSMRSVNPLSDDVYPPPSSFEQPGDAQLPSSRFIEQPARLFARRAVTFCSEMMNALVGGWVRFMATGPSGSRRIAIVPGPADGPQITPVPILPVPWQRFSGPVVRNPRHGSFKKPPTQRGLGPRCQADRPPKRQSTLEVVFRQICPDNDTASHHRCRTTPK